jgi:hypothetical protein
MASSVCELCMRDGYLGEKILHYVQDDKEGFLNVLSC